LISKRTVEMELHNLKPAAGAVKNNKRVGRGQGSGGGGTASRGHKGAKSRSGYSKKRGFEGGQMPIQRRLPKRGFKNYNRVEYVAINLGRIQALIEKHNLTKIDFETLRELNVVGQNDKVKVLGTGEITSKVDVVAHAFSETAKSAIEALGGTVTTL
jgi:large subunit ribosomal protein L15